MELKPGADSRVEFARWLTAPENPWFARNIVNRIWFWLLGRGIVHEPDDMRPTNLPENPALLDYLAKDLVDHRYDLRHIYRLILNSRTYQLSSVPRAHCENGGNHFAHYNSRRLTAEQMIDALAQVIEVKRSDFAAFDAPRWLRSRRFRTTPGRPRFPMGRPMHDGRDLWPADAGHRL